MRYFEARIVENRNLGAGYYILRLGGCDALAGARPGQFVMLRADWERDPLLPRAFSLMSVGPNGHASMLIKNVGRATAMLERAQPGVRVWVLGPLGSSFPDPSPDILDLLVAGGVGLPPMLMQAELAARSRLQQNTEMLYGGRASRDLVLLTEIKATGVGLHLATEDGSLGRRGRVTAELEARLEQHRSRPVRVLACGPNAMLWAAAAIARHAHVPCFISVEERMACGIGVCLGCAVAAHSRPFRYVCKDGPVFDAEELAPPQNAEATPPPGTAASSGQVTR